MKKYLIFFALLLCIFVSKAQVTISFAVNELQFRTNDLWSFVLTTTPGSRLNCKTEVLLKYKSTTVASAVSKSFILEGTKMMMGSFEATTASVSYYPNEISGNFSQGGMLSGGNYLLCVKVLSSDEPFVYAEECYAFDIKDFVSIIQTYPLNNEIIYTLNPLLQWIAAPAGNNYQYKLKLTKLSDEKSLSRSLRTQANFLADVVLRENQLIYPSSGPPLEYGGTYIWQVLLFRDNAEAAQSDTWKFTIGSSPKRLASIEENSFRKILSTVNNDPYLFNDFVFFSYENTANDGRLKYTLKDLSAGTITTSPYEVDLKFGMNKIVIPTDELSLVENQSYLLEVRDSYNKKYFMVFKYLTE